MTERSSDEDINSDNEATHVQQRHSLLLNARRDWKLFNVVLLGVTFLFVFTAFQTCSMVQVRLLFIVYIGM